MSGYIVLLLGGLQGLILASVIYTKAKKQQANQYLAAFILLLGLGSIVDNNLVQIDQNFFVLIWSGNSFLFAPFLYLYILRLKKSFAFSSKIVLSHFTIFAVMKVLVLSIHFSTITEDWLPILGISVNLFLVIYNVVYGIFTLHLLMKGKKDISQKQYKWGKAITLIFISYSILLLARRLISDVLLIELTLVDDYIYVGATLTLYWMSYQIIHRPDLISQGQRYKKSGLTHSDIVRKGEEIKLYLESGEVYKNPEFSLDLLSQNLDIPKHQISQVLTEHFGQTFYQLINEFRVREVTKILSAESHSHMSLLGIAYECGFQSKSTFNKAFRSIMGTTPSKYLQTK
ncbi:MAG: helix-turn-helix domain-containing protein [Cyclobacteriaceae bacterium]